MGHVASPALGGWKIEWLYRSYQSLIPWSAVNPEVLQIFQKEIRVPQMILPDRSMCMIPHQGFVLPSLSQPTPKKADMWSCRYGRNVAYLFLICCLVKDWILGRRHVIQPDQDVHVCVWKNMVRCTLCPEWVLVITMYFGGTPFCIIFSFLLFEMFWDGGYLFLSFFCIMLWACIFFYKAPSLFWIFLEKDES